MFTFFQCIAESVAAKGLVSLAREVPFGSFLFDVASDAWKRLRGKKKEAELRAEVQNMAQAAADEVRHAAAKAAREAFPKDPAKAIELELYLSQIPATVRQSLRRSEDPTGTTMSASFPLSRAEDLLTLLPTRVSRFRPGDGLPGREGWRLTDLLGTGGFGEVWLAIHPHFGSLRRAVKFCLDLSDRDRTLLHEGGLIDRVMRAGGRDNKVPNVVSLIDANLAGATPWLMYEYVSGGDLVALVAGWRDLAVADRHDRAITALKQIAGAVAHFHHRGVIHRDLKPANVLVAKEESDDPKGGWSLVGASDSSFQLKVADFGIGGVSAAHELALDLRMASTGARLATVARGAYTPTYASKQQKSGNPPDPRDDVFALGVIGYQLLQGDVTAERPVGKGWRRALESQGVQPALLSLLEVCWDDDPTERPSDAGDLLAQLDRSLKSVTPPIPKARPKPPETYPELPLKHAEEILTLGPETHEERSLRPRRPEREHIPRPRDPFRGKRSEWPDWVQVGLWGLRDRSTAVITANTCLIAAVVAVIVAVVQVMVGSWLGIVLSLGVGAVFGSAGWWCLGAVKWVDRNVEPIEVRPSGMRGVKIALAILGIVVLLVGITLVVLLMKDETAKSTSASTAKPNNKNADVATNGTKPATANASSWIVGEWKATNTKSTILLRFTDTRLTLLLDGDTFATGEYQMTDETLTFRWDKGNTEVWNRSPVAGSMTLTLAQGESKVGYSHLVLRKDVDLGKNGGKVGEK